ncbi:hypothetical protein KY346_04435 [Candidatus Woesearchaeota archaeon]|nr:hypothetical protein [Candidatus Woesearchaeota archaeon]
MGYENIPQVKDGFGLIKKLCRRKPDCAEGILYFQAGNAHTFIGYHADNGTVKVEPLFTVTGKSMQKCLEEIARRIFERDGYSERSLRVLPFSMTDLESFKNGVPTGEISLDEEDIDIYFTCGTNPLKTSYKRPSGRHRIPNLGKNGRKKELEALKQNILARHNSRPAEE